PRPPQVSRCGNVELTADRPHESSPDPRCAVVRPMLAFRLRYATSYACRPRRPGARSVRCEMTLEVAELQPVRMRSSGSLRPSETLGSFSSGGSIRRSAITFARASSRVRPWLTAPGTSFTLATATSYAAPAGQSSDERLAISRSLSVMPPAECVDQRSLTRL